MVKVRAAGLWEHPVGRMGVEKRTDDGVVTAGRHLVDGHAALDLTCRKIAPLLNITLPNRASPQQTGPVEIDQVLVHGPGPQLAQHVAPVRGGADHSQERGRL